MAGTHHERRCDNTGGARRCLHFLKHERPTPGRRHGRPTTPRAVGAKRSAVPTSTGPTAVVVVAVVVLAGVCFRDNVAVVVFGQPSVLALHVVVQHGVGRVDVDGVHVAGDNAGDRGAGRHSHVRQLAKLDRDGQWQGHDRGEGLCGGSEVVHVEETVVLGVGDQVGHEDYRSAQGQIGDRIDGGQFFSKVPGWAGNGRFFGGFGSRRPPEKNARRTCTVVAWWASSLGCGGVVNRIW